MEISILGVGLGCLIALLFMAVFGFFIVAYGSRKIRRGVMDEESAYRFIEDSRCIIQDINSAALSNLDEDDDNFYNLQIDTFKVCQNRYELLSRLTLEKVMDRKSFDLRDYYNLEEWKTLMNIQ